MQRQPYGFSLQLFPAEERHTDLAKPRSVARVRSMPPAGFCGLDFWWAGVGFVVELDDELGFERGGIAEDEVDGFAVDFVLVGLPLRDAGSGIDEFAELDLGEDERAGGAGWAEGGKTARLVLWRRRPNRTLNWNCACQKLVNRSPAPLEIRFWLRRARTLGSIW